MSTPSYTALIGDTVGTIADRAKDFKKLKYQDIIIVTILYVLQMILQMLLGAKACSFQLKLGRHIKEEAGESNAFLKSQSENNCGIAAGEFGVSCWIRHCGRH